MSQTVLLHVADYAHDFAEPLWPVCNVYSLADRVLVGKEFLGQFLADDRGFVFEGRPGGVEVILTRIQDYAVQDNVFRAPAFLGMRSIASSGRVAGNYFSGVETGAVLAGGYDASPSKVTFTGNRAVHNNLGGVLLNGASIGIPELGDELDVVVRDNDLSDNTLTPNFSFGVRCSSFGATSALPGTHNPQPIYTRYCKATDSSGTK